MSASMPSPRSVTSDAPAVLSARDLARDYAMGGDRVHAVRGVTLDVDEGDWVAIVGPSGCGKSTLLNLLGAIDRPDAGSVVLRGRDVADMRDVSRPRTRTWPRDGRSMTPSRLSIVLLPQPDGPTSATYSPSATSSETPRTACTSSPPMR